MNQSSMLLEARNLLLDRDGRRVLDLSSLRIEPGGSLALLGPNGSGKSSLLLALAGLLPPTGGELRFQGDPLDPSGAALAHRRRVGLVLQQPVLLSGTVRANVESGLRLRRVAPAERRERAGAAAARLGIEGLLDRPARSLSGGEAQRTALARALVLEPELLLLDEPFASLDPPSREALLEDLGAILRDSAATVVLATHDLEEALRLASRIAVLRGGRLIQEGPALEVINRPADPETAAFLGMECVFRARVDSAGGGAFTALAQGHRLEGLGSPRPDAEVLLGIRPEQVLLSLPPGAATSARNVLPARILRLVPKGPYLKAELDCGFPLSAHLTPRSREELGLEEGTPVLASFKATALHLIGEERDRVRQMPFFSIAVIPDR